MRMSPHRFSIRARWAFASLALAVLCTSWTSLAPGQQRSGAQKRTPQSKPNRPAEATTTAAKQHPLDQALALARECQEAYQQVSDYRAILYRQERIDGSLTDLQEIQMKFRKEPFSVYLRWIKPHRGREVIYSDGKYDGKLIAHETGVKDAIAGTVELDPHGKRAMKDSRHAITDAGIGHMIDRMVTTWEHERRFAEIEAKFYKNAKVGGRVCTVIQVHHPVPRKEFQYCLAKLWIDDELKLPIRFEGYDWPRRKGEQPELVESYTYGRVQINPGLNELDFDVNNGQYSFYK